MNRSLTGAGTDAAVRQITQDLIDALIAERLLPVDAGTLRPPADAPELAGLYPAAIDALAYAGDVCLLVRPSRRQGYQWAAGTAIYRRTEAGWAELRSPSELCRIALQRDAHAYPGLADLLQSLDTAVWQLALSLSSQGDGGYPAPRSDGEWYAKGERIASLRDRPFHPAAKAKIGYAPRDYERYMAEFGLPVALHWAAIDSRYVVAGSPDGGTDALDALGAAARAAVEGELSLRGLSRPEYTVIPVHPWQLENRIRPGFGREIAEGTIVILDTQAGAFTATSSVRTMMSADAPGLMLKLPISVASLGAARYLPVVKLMNGLAGERMFRQALACDETLADKVHLCEEKRWWGYMPPTMGLFDEHPRHLAAQLRAFPPEALRAGSRIVPMSALGVLPQGKHFLSELLGADVTEAEAIRFYAQTAALFLEVALRLFKIGIVPEMHGQNCCLVLRNGVPSSLLFRDHDSVRLHQPYLDRHGIGDPGYRIRPGYGNSLYNETPEKLMFYIQSLGVQVNLASIMESLAEAYGIPVDALWDITETLMKDALRQADLPAPDKERLSRLLFDAETWPTKLVIRPLLETDGVPGAMPSGKGDGHNPFYRPPTGSAKE